MTVECLRQWHTHLSAGTRREAASEARRAARGYADPKQARMLRFKADVSIARCLAQDTVVGRYLDAAFQPVTAPSLSVDPTVFARCKYGAEVAACLVLTAIRQIVDWGACMVGAFVGAARYLLPVHHGDRLRAGGEQGPATENVSGAAAALVGANPAKFCIVTQYTDNTAPYAEIAVANQHAYAQRNGYETMAFNGRISGQAFLSPSQGGPDSLRGGGLYWQKLSALDMALSRVDDAGHRKYDWVLWLDSDIIVTRPDQTLENIIASYAPEESDKHVILSREEAGRQDVPINAGAIFVKNSDAGRRFVQTIAGMYDAYASHAMPEQDAITDFAFGLRERAFREPWDRLRQTLRADIAVAPQRTFNSFVRSHRVDEEQARWQPGDFVAHISCGNVADRVARMRGILATVGA